MNNSSFGFDKPEDSPGFLLWQTTVTWQRLIKKELDHFHISHAQFVILAILLWLNGKNQIATQLLIVKMSKLDKMTVSKSLKNLASQELLKRDEFEKDTRVKKIILTENGQKLAIKLVPIVEKIDADFFGKLNQKDQKEFIQLLNQIMD